MNRSRLVAVLAVAVLVAAACGSDSDDGDGGASAAPAAGSDEQSADAVDSSVADADDAGGSESSEASSSGADAEAGTESPEDEQGEEAGATTTTETATTTAAPTTTAAASTTTTEPTPTTAAVTTTTEPTSTTAAVTTTSAVPAESEWELVAGSEDCRCADGSDYSYWVREADPNKVVFYLQGGGACFSRASCSFTDGNYDVTVDPTEPGDNPAVWSGIFDLDNPHNPLADHSFVVVPYCTGDVHLGNNSNDYGDGPVHHNGYVNATTALATAVERFGSASEVVVSGSSAGSASAALYGGLAADAFGDASIAVVADASGAYPSEPAINATIGALWGTFSVVPDWPVNEGMTPTEWGLPELFVQAGKHAPRIRFSRFDNAFDGVQQAFALLAGFTADNMDQLIRQNEAFIEGEGVPVASFTAPGRDHTILWRPELYTLEVEGVLYRDWLAAFLAGDDVEDVTCVDCS